MHDAGIILAICKILRESAENGLVPDLPYITVFRNLPLTFITFECKVFIIYLLYHLTRVITLPPRIKVYTVDLQSDWPKGPGFMELTPNFYLYHITCGKLQLSRQFLLVQPVPHYPPYYL
jgi:hypothetical protein